MASACVPRLEAVSYRLGKAKRASGPGNDMEDSYLPGHSTLSSWLPGFVAELPPVTVRPPLNQICTKAPIPRAGWGLVGQAHRAAWWQYSLRIEGISRLESGRRCPTNSTSH